MSSPTQRGTHVSRLFAALRQQRGLRPSQLAARLGASNVTKIGSLIRSFELGDTISDHWLQRLVGELQPDPEDLRHCLELDHAKAEAEARRELERQRLAWEAWADEPSAPHLTVRYIPGVYGVRPVPQAFCSSREQAEGWAAAELKRFRAKGFLVWSRREHTVFDEYGVNPRRLPVSFRHQGASASMQVSGNQRRFLLGPDGGVVTGGYGLDSPASIVGSTG